LPRHKTLRKLLQFLNVHHLWILGVLKGISLSPAMISDYSIIAFSKFRAGVIFDIIVFFDLIHKNRRFLRNHKRLSEVIFK
jgi:hypothetical protein